MCGIVGFVDPSITSTAEELRGTVSRMSACMAHRGPDDSGAWVDPTAGIALGHRRLAILDLSPEGHQPMISGDDRLVIAFNGEIYNFAQLRRSLESSGYHFRGHSDTEVLLAGICEWGFEQALKKSVGMFAIALWDRTERTLWLARDRMGEKPLYYGWQGGTFMFSSDLKPLAAHPKWRAEIDRNSLALLMRYGYIPAPYSIYHDIRKLPAAGILRLDCRSLGPHKWPVPDEYWSARACAESGAANPFSGSDAEAVSELDEVLRESVRLQMVADVPLGAFLSGGIDSSTVVALMQAQSSRPVKTFSIGFREEDYNEARHAKAVAKHLGTDHTELYVTPTEAMAVIPSLPAIYSEPFSDASQIPTYLVARLARRHVTVSLSGDGGDELFCGYPRYAAGLRLSNTVGRMPRLARAGLGALVAKSPSSWLNATLLRFHDRSLGKTTSQPRSRAEWNAIGQMLDASGEERFYRGLVSHWPEPSALVTGASEPPDALTDKSHWAILPDFLRWMMYVDAVSYLPDDILVKVDRAAMGVSLETRVPLLDHRVVEFAWRLPTHLTRRGGQGKWLLRQVLYKYVPKQMVERPKMGFSVPIDLWLRGPLRDWAETLLAPSRLKSEGYFDAALVQEKWAEHLSGRVDCQYLLWDVLMFQSWLEASREPVSAFAPQAVCS